MTEVMIVMVVTAALFATAVVLISGRQNRVEFSQSVNELKGQLEQTISRVGAGYYADTAQVANRKCSASGGGITFGAGGSSQRGSSGDCIFMGAAVQFGAGGNGQQYVVHTVLGLRRGTTMTTANPRLLYPTTADVAVNIPNGSIEKRLQGGMTVYKMTIGNLTPSKPSQIGGFAVVSGVGSYTASGLDSGTQQLALYPLLPTGMPGVLSQLTPLKTDTNNFARLVNANMKNLTAAQANPTEGLQLCVVSGGSNQSALLTIGGTSRALSVSSIIKENTTCA